MSIKNLLDFKTLLIAFCATAPKQALQSLKGFSVLYNVTRIPTFPDIVTALELSRILYVPNVPRNRIHPNLMLPR